MRKHLATAMQAGTLLALGFAAATPASADDRIKRGEYLATIMDCGGCHTTGALVGKPDPTHDLAGSQVGFQIPGLGVFYPPNLTPDRDTGLAPGARSISSGRCEPVRDPTAASSCRSCRIRTMPG